MFDKIFNLREKGYVSNIQVDILFINKNYSFNDLIENLFKNTLFTFYT